MGLGMSCSGAVVKRWCEHVGELEEEGEQVTGIKASL